MALLTFPALLIGEGLGGILFDGFEGGNDCAEEGADDSDGSGDRPPEVDGLLHERGGDGVEHEPLGAVGHKDAEDSADKGEEDGLAEEDVEDVAGAGADGFEDADLAGALKHGGVHGHEDDDEADDSGDADDDADEVFKHGDGGDGELRGELLDGVDLVTGEIFPELRGEGIRGARVVQLEVDGGDFAFVAGESLEDVDACEDACELAGLIDSSDAPDVAGEGEVVAGVDFFLFGVVLVDDDVIVCLKGSALEEFEAAGHAVDGGEVDALDGVEAADALDHGAGCELDAGFGGEDGDGLLGHGCGGERHGGGAGRTDEDVGTDASGSAGGGIEGAEGDADEGEDHGDLDADGEDGEEGPQRAMREVSEDKLIDQVKISIRQRRGSGWERRGVRE